MAAQKPKKVERPKLAKEEAKGKIVTIWFNVEDFKLASCIPDLKADDFKLEHTQNA
jgi:hypothetical protein